MSLYKVKFYYGDYHTRQRNANNDKAVLYVEQRFNTFSRKSNYTLVKVTDAASDSVVAIAADYANIISNRLNIPLYENDVPGVIRTRRGRRGDDSIRVAEMPAILLEPMFVSNPEHVQLFWNNGREILADTLAIVTRKYFPEGGLIGFSVGHRYKRSSPFDQGSHCWGTPEFSEASLSEQVLWVAKFFLEFNLGLEKEE
jgi:hypothetical protein